MQINVDFSEKKGKIKPMHGVGHPPFAGLNFDMFQHLTDAGIPFSRLHDIGGPYGGNKFVDIPNLFRNFDADPYDPASYDFTFTDLLISALVKYNVEPFFRLGVTIENQAEIKAYRIFPPKDFKKWAIICEHVIRHYTEGWADGFHYNIRYWEIWNEPENSEVIEKNQMWMGTKEQFYELYNVASKHLKACFPHLKIGGYGSCGFYSIKDTFLEIAASTPRTDYFIEFLDGFLAYIKENDCPLDFFSWHNYDNIANGAVYAHYIRKRLDEAGFTETESTCDEWNCYARYRGTALHASLVGGMMLAFQDTPLDSAMFYDARFGTSIFGSLFNPLTREPFPAYYAFTAFNRLYQLGNQCVLSLDTEGIYAVAAKDGKKGCIVISNPTDSDLPLSISMEGTVTECRIITDGKNDEICSLPSVMPKESVLSIWVVL